MQIWKDMLERNMFDGWSKQELLNKLKWTKTARDKYISESEAKLKASPILNEAANLWAKEKKN